MKYILHTYDCYFIKDPANRNWDKLVLYVEADSLPPDLMKWMEVNPRGQNMNRDRVKTIKQSLESNEVFHVLNRGVGINVAGFCYSAANGTLQIELTDPQVHGIFDGGHSLRTILEAQALPPGRKIAFEVFNLGLEDVRQLARARNTTVEVDLRSLANLEQEFDLLQELFAPLPFADRIEYKSNDDGRDIDVKMMLSILFMFCNEVFPIKDRDAIRLKEPEQALKQYLSWSREERERILRPMAPILSQIFLLWDRVEADFPLKLPRRKNGGQILAKCRNIMEGRGALLRERKTEGTTCFGMNSTMYKVSIDAIRPIVAAFAALVRIAEDGIYYWISDPMAMWDKFAAHHVASFLDNRVPIKKNKVIWTNLYIAHVIDIHRSRLQVQQQDQGERHPRLCSE